MIFYPVDLFNTITFYITKKMYGFTIIAGNKTIVRGIWFRINQPFPTRTTIIFVFHSYISFPLIYLSVVFKGLSAILAQLNSKEFFYILDTRFIWIRSLSNTKTATKFREFFYILDAWKYTRKRAVPRNRKHQRGGRAGAISGAYVCRVRRLYWCGGIGPVVRSIAWCGAIR